MSDVSAVRVSPTWAVPAMVGAPVGVLFGSGPEVTAAVAALVSDSSLPPSSVNVPRTLTAHDGCRAGR